MNISTSLSLSLTGFFIHCTILKGNTTSNPHIACISCSHLDKSQMGLNFSRLGGAHPQHPTYSLVGLPELQLGVSIDRGTPEWMIYNGKSNWNGWFRGTFQETSIEPESCRILPTFLPRQDSPSCVCWLRASACLWWWRHCRPWHQVGDLWCFSLHHWTLKFIV